VHSEIVRTQALDQRVVNNTLYSGMAENDFGLKWDRFPPEIWASSQAYFGPPPANVAVHHANFTLEKAISKDPSLKLDQMAMLARYAAGEDKEELLQFIKDTQVNQSMLDYRDRHFGVRRPGPEWCTLPQDHVARPGGFREKKQKGSKAIAIAASTDAATTATDDATEVSEVLESPSPSAAESPKEA